MDGEPHIPKCVSKWYSSITQSHCLTRNLAFGVPGARECNCHYAVTVLCVPDV